jgi:hypothetical protein
MQISKKWKKILLVGLLAKISITICLFAILVTLHKNLNDLKSTHDLVLSKIESSLLNLEKPFETEKKVEQINNLSSEDLSSSKLHVLKAIGSIRSAISNGAYMDFGLIKDTLTQEELDIMSKDQSNITGKDLDLVQELKLCLKYTDSNLSSNKQPDRIIIEKIIEVQEEDKYKSSVAAMQSLSNSITALELGHYDIALLYLNDISQQSPINLCIQGVAESIKARISTNNILTSLEKRILND